MKTSEELQQCAEAIYGFMAHGRTDEAIQLLDLLQTLAVQPYKDLGIVYVPPDDWDHMGMGGPPPIGEYRKIDLDDPWLFDSPC